MKTRALTQQLYVDEVESEDQGIAEMTMNDNSFAQITRKLFISTQGLTKSYCAVDLQILFQPYLPNY